MIFPYRLTRLLKYVNNPKSWLEDKSDTYRNAYIVTLKTLPLVIAQHIRITPEIQAFKEQLDKSTQILECKKICIAMLQYLKKNYMGYYLEPRWYYNAINDLFQILRKELTRRGEAL
jgi:hypothetical protein